MLQSLDTLIAFVVILLTTSLLVTILVQMLSSAFALRGKNLGNALALTFQSIDPTIGANAYKLAERILADPRLSDSLFANKRAGKTVKPDQEAPWGWWSLGKGWQLAGDIRPDEIHQLLTKIGAGADDTLVSISPTLYPQIASAGKNLLTKLRILRAPAAHVPDTLAGAAKNLLGELRAPHVDVAKARSDLAKIQAGVSILADSAQKTDFTNAVTSATASLQSVEDHIATELDSLAQHFNAAQDRAQQWFQMHTRIFTIVCGIFLAFLFQLDSVEIFKFVSTNATARAALAASADKLVEKADGILERNPNLLDRIYDIAKKEMPDINLSKEARDAATNTASLKSALLADGVHKVPDDFDNKFSAAIGSATASFYKDRRAQMDELTGTVAATGFDLVPKKLWHRWDASGETFGDHFLGMLITAGLLSLGAPFWYNSLKDLTSLRPAVSKIIDEEKAKK